MNYAPRASEIYGGFHDYYAFWPDEVVHDKNSAYYGQYDLVDSVSLWQSRFIYMDILLGGKNRAN